MAKRPARTVPPVPFAHFLTCDEITRYVQALAAARPDLCRLESLGSSRDGRPLHLLVLTDFTTAAPEDRPAYLIHDNIHASEVAGVHLALHTARQLLTADRALLSRLTFYIVPRINPDGAEHVVTTGGQVRSRTDQSERLA
ncbi:MAG: M14 family zinc carboxypeptidase, partial [Gemmatimonadota bacterium]